MVQFWLQLKLELKLIESVYFFFVYRHVVLDVLDNVQEEALHKREKEDSCQLEQDLQHEFTCVVDREIAISYCGHSLHDKVKAADIYVSA